MLEYKLRHRVAELDPYHTVVRLLDADPDKLLVGIKNVASIPNTLMHKLEKEDFSLHTIDKKSQLAGRAIDTEVINPISGRIMSGSSSGTAVNVFAGINDLGIGNDGGGSVLAPAISLNILSFISKLIEKDKIKAPTRPNTDGMMATSSIGFMAREKEILYKAIKVSIGVEADDDCGLVYSDKKYDGIDSKVVELLDSHTPRNTLVPFLENILKECDVLLVSEGPIDIDGLGDSLYGHFDERTKAYQERANKGYVRVCNIAGASALSLPQSGLGMAYLLMCESNERKIAKMLAVGKKINEVHDKLIERYFLDLNNYFIEGYRI